MNRKAAALAPSLAMMALAGCNMMKPVPKPADGVTPAVYNANAERPGRVIEPKFCQLETARVIRPVGEAVVDASAWNAADEQAISIDARRALEANGLRAGVITGELPADLVEAFRPSPPKQPTQWVHVALPEGESTPIVLRDKAESVTLLIDRSGRVDGRDYLDAGGRLIVTPSHSGSKAVGVRIVPEVQHGEPRRTIAAVQNGGPFSPREFTMKDGQKEEILRELAVSVDLQPGQTLVLGGRLDQPRSLGAFLFTQPEAEGDKVLQSVLLIRAARNKMGEVSDKPLDEPGELPDLAVRPMPAPTATAPRSIPPR